MRSRILAAAALVAAPAAFAQNPCVEPDENGTVSLPPASCGYLSPDDVHILIDGLPAGTTIEIGVEHQKFFNITRQPGGRFGPDGEIELFDSLLFMDMNGTGALAGFSRFIVLQINSEVNTGPRNAGDPVQQFPNEYMKMQGELFGDPDFDAFGVTGGTDFGLPSPGETTLTRLPSGNFNVDSFFDITYQIDFQGAPGSVLEGLGGRTQATIRMSTGEPAGPDCPGDIDGDGRVAFSDILRILGEWGPYAPCPPFKPEDLNMNCRVDFGDILIVLGNWGECPNNTGACCLPDGTCRDLELEACLDLQGAYRGDGTNCDDPGICDILGACCLEEGGCIDGITEPACAESGGFLFFPNRSCNDVQCPVVTGACCLPTGACVEIDINECLAGGGDYRGDGTTCNDPGICDQTGACCLADGTCRDVTFGECLELRGDYRGDGTDCSDPGICQPVGACCVEGGCIDGLTESECLENGGLAWFPNRQCGEIECPGSGTGACCFGPNECVELTRDECLAQQGQYQGDGTTCNDPGICDPGLGACCFGPNECFETTQNECVASGGAYVGDGTTCAEPRLCDRGACCLPDGTCLPWVAPGECDARGGVFLGPSTTCDQCPQ